MMANGNFLQPPKASYIVFVKYNYTPPPPKKNPSKQLFSYTPLSSPRSSCSSVYISALGCLGSIFKSVYDRWEQC